MHIHAFDSVEPMRSKKPWIVRRIIVICAYFAVRVHWLVKSVLTLPENDMVDTHQRTYACAQSFVSLHDQALTVGETSIRKTSNRVRWRTFVKLEECTPSVTTGMRTRAQALYWITGRSSPNYGVLLLGFLIPKAIRYCEPATATFNRTVSTQQ
jgi:hypothetical protein